MKPLVSILIPAYNAEKWIADTLRSALGQTWERREVIVVDDGSTDFTLTVARQFESKGVRVITQSNQGAAAARNKLLSLSQGDYIQWLDADDLLAPDKVSRQIEALNSNEGPRTLLTSSWGRFMYRPQRAVFTPTPLWCDNLSPLEFLTRRIGHTAWMQTATWLVSRELCEAAGPWNTTMLSDDDGEYFFRVVSKSDGIRFVPEARVYYRVVGSTSLGYVGTSNKKLEALWHSIQLHIGYLRLLEDSDQVRSACIQFLQRSMDDFYPFRLDIAEQMHQTAQDLGGSLSVPMLSWKYSWIKSLFGWHHARRAQLFVRSFKMSLLRFWDKALYSISEPLP